MSCFHNRQSKEMDSVNSATSAAGLPANRPLRETGGGVVLTPWFYRKAGKPPSRKTAWVAAGGLALVKKPHCRRRTDVKCWQPSAMSEFKFACPVCGQHMMCDTLHGGSTMDCPTCFQKITAPQAPAPDTKFILTGTMVTDKKNPTPLPTNAPAVVGKKFPAGMVLALVLSGVVGALGFAFHGKIVPPAWQAGDIGQVGTPGSFRDTGGKFTVNGSGADIWGRADGFYYVFQRLDGDGAVTARVLGLKNTDPWAKGGVMIRATHNADSMFTLVAMRPDGQVQFAWRSATGADVATSALAGGNGSPKWVKLARSGNVFSAYYKANASEEWKLVGDPQTINMMPKAQVGLVVCAHHAGIICTAQFDQVGTGKKAGLK